MSVSQTWTVANCIIKIEEKIDAYSESVLTKGTLKHWCCEQYLDASCYVSGLRDNSFNRVWAVADIGLAIIPVLLLAVPLVASIERNLYYLSLLATPLSLAGLTLLIKKIAILKDDQSLLTKDQAREALAKIAKKANQLVNAGLLGREELLTPVNEVFLITV